MVNLIKEGLLTVKWIPRFETLRFNRRVNVQRPRAPDYRRALYNELVEPFYPKPDSYYLPPSLKCKKREELEAYVVNIENPLEKIIARELYEKLESSQLVGFLHCNPIDGYQRFEAQVLLKRQGIEVDVFSKKTVAVAVQGTFYEPILSLFVCHNIIAFSKEPCADKLIQTLKKIPQYVLLAGIIDKKFLNINQLQKYAELKDVTTARAQLVGTLNSIGQQMVHNLTALPQNLSLQLNSYKEMKSKSQ